MSGLVILVLGLAGCGMDAPTPPEPAAAAPPSEPVRITSGGQVDGIPDGSSVVVLGEPFGQATTKMAGDKPGEKPEHLWTPTLKLEGGLRLPLVVKSDPRGLWKRTDPGRRARAVGTLKREEEVTGVGVRVHLTEPPTWEVADPSQVEISRQAEEGQQDKILAQQWRGLIGDGGWVFLDLVPNRVDRQLIATFWGQIEPANGTAPLQGDYHKLTDVVFVDVDGDGDLEVVALVMVTQEEGAAPVSSPVVYDLEGGAVGVRDLGAKLKGASTADEVRAAFSAG